MNRTYDFTGFGSLFSALSSLLGPMHGTRARPLQPGEIGLERRGAPGLERLLATARLWHRRARQRLELRSLDDHILQDVGLTREEVEAETRKPFWRA